MIAILSDVHGNLEALTAVLADADRRGATAVYHLGDLVGYGPNPVECVERARNFALNLQGDHDFNATLLEPEGFPPSLERVFRWSREQLRARPDDPLRWLEGLTTKETREAMLFVHGSPCNPFNEYLFPEDIHNPRKLARIAAGFDRHCFCGHTHIPGVFRQREETGEWGYTDPGECGGFWRVDRDKAIVNVGSVGQPRDGDWRACYVLLDGWDVTFRRVEYDVETTVRKIYENPEIDDMHGDRLREGR